MTSNPGKKTVRWTLPRGIEVPEVSRLVAEVHQRALRDVRETTEAFYHKTLRDARRKALEEAAAHLQRLLAYSDNKLERVSDDALVFAVNQICAMIEKEGK